MTQTTSVTPEAPHWILMAKAHRGELTEREKQDFTAWLEEDKTHAEQWAAATKAWKAVDTQTTSSFTPDVDCAWEKMKARLDFSTKALPSDIEQENAISTGFEWSTYLRYAAVVVLAVGLGWLGYMKWNDSTQWTEVATLTGEKKSIYLPDSSLVTLNGNSTLRYQSAFNKQEREVELTGESFFQVKKNPAQPFIVYTGNTKTKVLGTSFNVRALSEEKEVSVAVITGKVAFSSKSEKEKVILTPGFTGTMHSNGSLDKKETGSAKPSWNTLSFQGTTLQEVAVALEARFGISIQFTSPALASCVFTGTFENPDLQNILQVLAVSNKIQFDRNSSGIYQLSGEGCAR